jgi:hypothetical protein
MPLSIILCVIILLDGPLLTEPIKRDALFIQISIYIWLARIKFEFACQ